MTRYEAIAVLEKEASIIDDNSIEMTMREWDEFDDLKRDAIPVAIEALKAKTDGDIISREKAVNEIHKYFVEEIDKTPTEIDEDGDEVYTDMPAVNSLLACNKELSKRIKALPSDDAVQGEWVGFDECSLCGKQAVDFIEGCVDGLEYLPNYCPNCGARMKGADDE